MSDHEGKNAANADNLVDPGRQVVDNPGTDSPKKLLSPQIDSGNRAHKISIDSDDDAAPQTGGSKQQANSHFESEDHPRVDVSSPQNQASFDLQGEPRQNISVEAVERPISPPKTAASNDTIPTLQPQPVQESPTQIQEKELKTLLENNAMKKTCSEHNQAIITICTDFSCPKRFWCGICCVKSKDLYVKYSTHMVLISDFLEENVSKLYKVKTFSEADKNILENKLDIVVKKNETNYESVWELIEKDIDKYKRELLVRVDNSKNALKERLNKSLLGMKGFYGDLKTKVKESKTRDVAQELQILKEKVEQNQLDTLEMIETIGNKVNVDIIEIQNMNSNFNKTKSFIDYVFDNYDVMRDQTVPNYVSMEKWIDSLVDKVEVLSAPKIKMTLEDPNKDLDSVFNYYEKLMSNQMGTLERNGIMNSYVRTSDPRDRINAIQQELEESVASNKRGNVHTDLRRHVTKDEKKHSQTPTMLSDKLEVQSRPLHTSRPQLSQGNSSNISPTGHAKTPGYSNFPTTVINNEVLDLSDKNQMGVFDGNLIPQYTDADIDTIDKVASMALAPDTKDFQPIIYLHNNQYLICSFTRKESSGTPQYGFKISLLPEDGRLDGGRIPTIYSSDNLFLIQAKICNIMVIERDSDNVTLLCVNTEDGYIYLFSMVLSEDEDAVIELESTIIPKQYDGVMTSMKRLANTDYLVCTNTKGEIVTFDTIKAEMLSSEKHCEGTISTSCFVQENAFFLIGSGSVEGVPNENSLTFLSVNFVKDKKQYGVEYPSFKYKVRVKKAHGDKFGVVAVTADNTKSVPLIFSAGGSDDPCIKVWNFESKELLTTVETKELFTHIYLNLIVFKSGGNADNSKEIKSAWRARAEELPSYKRLRDEKKRRKTDDSSQTYILLCATNRVIRAVRIILRGKTKADIKELTSAFDTKPRTANAILQTSKVSDEAFTICAAGSTGRVDLFQMRMSPNS